MGEIADGLIDGTFDEITGEYLGEGPGYPRTRVKGQYNTIKEAMIQHSDGRITTQNHDPKNYSKGTKAIRKELAILIKEKIKNNLENKGDYYYLERARQEINIKYGKGWREQY